VALVSNSEDFSAPARIGCAGWNIPRDSAGGFAAQGTHLARYASVFDCVEINSSFYRPHKQSTWERWRESVPADFKFSVKAPKAITHEAQLRCGPEALPEFLQQLAGLREKLGPVLFQLPPSLEFDAGAASHFLSLLRDQYSGEVLCEPRHQSWFEEDADELLREFQVARVAADPARVPGAAEPGGAQSLAYFRLHGSPRTYYSAYDDDFLSALADQLRKLAARASTWCIFDNTALGAATRNAITLSEKLARGRKR